VNRRRVDAILKGAQRYLRGLGALEVIEIWRGLRPCTPDGLPYVGRTSKFNNLCIATGHAMMGLSLGPITGKLIAQTISGQTPQISSALLNPDRYH
jgi:D-amino-acid dehydrogenase